MSKTLKLALAASAIAAASWATAAPLNIAGALSNTDPLYNRLVSGNPPVLLSGVGTAVRYDIYNFYVTVTGSYRMETLSAAFTTATADDTFITLYLGSGFTAGTPLVGALEADDDSGVGFLSLINRNLVANTNYSLVITSFANGQLGNYTGIIAAAVGQAGDVIAGTVPVSAPATGALVALALAGLALTSRRRAS